MKKILSLSLIILSGLLLSACGVKPNNDSATTTPSEMSKDSISTFSLRDLIVKNIPQKCTWSSNIDGAESKGTIVISGKKFKQETSVKQDGFDYIGHSVSDGTYLYTWQDNTDKDSPNVAIKMKLDVMNEAPESDGTPVPESSKPQDGLDLDKEYQYNCTPTVVSESDFQPPQDIEFVDYSQFLEDIQSNIPKN
jgi:hypothetical protein